MYRISGPELYSIFGRSATSAEDGLRLPPSSYSPSSSAQGRDAPQHRLSVWTLSVILLNLNNAVFTSSAVLRTEYKTRGSKLLHARRLFRVIPSRRPLNDSQHGAQAPAAVWHRLALHRNVRDCMGSDGPIHLQTRRDSEGLGRNSGAW